MDSSQPQHEPPAPAMMRMLVVLPVLVSGFPALTPGIPAQSAPVLVTTEWVASRLADPGLVVLHVSSQRSDYDAGHIPGSRWLSWQALTRQRDGLSIELPDVAALDSVLESLGVSDGSRIVISGGPITMTARAYFTLDYFEQGRAIAQPEVVQGEVGTRGHRDRPAADHDAGSVGHT